MSFKTKVMLVPLASLGSLILLLVVALSSMGDLARIAQEVSLLAERQALVDGVEREMLSRAEKVYRSMAIGDGDDSDASMGRWLEPRQYLDAIRRVFPGSVEWAHYFEADAELERLWRNFENAAGKTPMTVEGAVELRSARETLGDRLAYLRDRIASEQRHTIHATRHAGEGIIAVGVLGAACFLVTLVIAAGCARGATLRLNCAISDINEISVHLAALAHPSKSGGNEVADIQSDILSAHSKALDGVNDDLVDFVAGRRWKRPTDSFGYPKPPGGNAQSPGDDFADF